MLVHTLMCVPYPHAFQFYSFIFAMCVWPGTTTTGGLEKQRFSKISMTTQHDSLPSLSWLQDSPRAEAHAARRGRSEVAMAKEGQGHAPPFPLAFRSSLTGRTPALSEGQFIGTGSTTHVML